MLHFSGRSNNLTNDLKNQLEAIFGIDDLRKKGAVGFNLFFLIASNDRSVCTRKISNNRKKKKISGFPAEQNEKVEDFSLKKNCVF